MLARQPCTQNPRRYARIQMSGHKRIFLQVASPSSFRWNGSGYQPLWNAAFSGIPSAVGVSAEVPRLSENFVRGLQCLSCFSTQRPETRPAAVKGRWCHHEESLQTLPCLSLVPKFNYQTITLRQPRHRGRSACTRCTLSMKSLALRTSTCCRPVLSRQTIAKYHVD